VTKKLLTLFLAFSILTLEAQARVPSGLKAAFDELNYALSVQWDQKDKEFQAQALEKFSAKVAQLQEQGLTGQEMIEFVHSQIKDQRLARDLETTFSMIQINKMTSQEAHDYVSQVLKNTYSSGASWISDPVVNLVFTLAVVVITIRFANYLNTVYGRSCYSQDVIECVPYCYDDAQWGDNCFNDCNSTRAIRCQ
jgi:hypothetical protein